ncbi:hypothetical protein FHG87_008244 [Trinorchestia longiramus]|nr:hypothetical protein FHG87_008244 [Trinorchestia longiramus]
MDIPKKITPTTIIKQERILKNNPRTPRKNNGDAKTSPEADLLADKKTGSAVLLRVKWAALNGSMFAEGMKNGVDDAAAHYAAPDANIQDIPGFKLLFGETFWNLEPTARKYCFCWHCEHITTVSINIG